MVLKNGLKEMKSTQQKAMEKQIINALLQQGMTIEEIKKYITEVGYERTEMKMSKTNKKLADTLLQALNSQRKGTVFITTKGKIG